MSDIAGELKKRFEDHCEKFVRSILSGAKIKKPDEHLIDNVVKLKNIFSNPTRVAIIFLLSQQPLPVCALVAILGKDQTLISHNLSVLKQIGIIEEKKEGKFRIYFLQKQKLIDLLNSIITHIKESSK